MSVTRVLTSKADGVGKPTVIKPATDVGAIINNALLGGHEWELYEGGDADTPPSHTVICRIYRKPVMYPYSNTMRDSAKIWVVHAIKDLPGNIGGAKDDTNITPDLPNWNDWTSNSDNKYPTDEDGKNWFENVAENGVTAGNTKTGKYWSVADAIKAAEDFAVELTV